MSSRFLKTLDSLTFSTVSKDTDRYLALSKEDTKEYPVRAIRSGMIYYFIISSARFRNRPNVALYFKELFKEIYYNSSSVLYLGQRWPMVHNISCHVVSPPPTILNRYPSIYFLQATLILNMQNYSNLVKFFIGVVTLLSFESFWS